MIWILYIHWFESIKTNVYIITRQRWEKMSCVKMLQDWGAFSSWRCWRPWAYMINRLLLLQKVMIFRAKWAEPVEQQPKVHATFFGWAVLGQKETNVGSCAPIRKDDDNWYEEFKLKNAQKVLNKEMMPSSVQVPRKYSKLFWIQHFLQKELRQENWKLFSWKRWTLPLQTTLTRTHCHSLSQIRRS